ncbi:AzlC family ABC transporter permease [Sinomonas sp. ASV322]|uniref:AzlC family ABC transporter permease n=1 Tax=Sinomonas sp. ASV322 TaxID=3041920 RepID=UPI0027DC8CAE|nr:AzlC family ABC transporter permease [Sinomonas sp. ASV322]MDQ4502627.1 AzlC family ABC transporter permease [Sinomonas sp. ASV322]
MNDSAGEARSDLVVAARETGVIWLGLFALGIGFGVLVTSHGFPWWLAPVISAVMFAGSVEFILVGMLAAGAPLAAVALTTFLVNARHLFYGLSFPLHRVRGRLRKAYSVFALCDEAFALIASKNPDTLTSGRILWTQLGLHASWASGALAGGLVGATLLGGLKGMGFLLTALFVVLTIDAFRENPDKLTAALAGGAGLLALALTPGSMLLVALSALSLAFVARHSLNRRSRHCRGTNRAAHNA